MHNKAEYDYSPFDWYILRNLLIYHNLGLTIFWFTSTSNALGVMDHVVVYDYIYSTHNSKEVISSSLPFLEIKSSIYPPKKASHNLN